MHHFIMTLDVEGVPERHAFSVSVQSFPSAVKRAVDKITKEKPGAEFVGLTYYHPAIGPDKPS